MKLIQESAVGPSSVKGTPGKSAVLIYLDCQLVGENSKRPSTKLPNVEPAHLQKLVSCALRGRGSVAIGKGNTQVDCPVEGDIMVVCDGGRRDDIGLAPFKSSVPQLQRNCQLLGTLGTDGDSRPAIGQGQEDEEQRFDQPGSEDELHFKRTFDEDDSRKKTPEIRRHEPWKCLGVCDLDFNKPDVAHNSRGQEGC